MNRNTTRLLLDVTIAFIKAYHKHKSTKHYMSQLKQTIQRAKRTELERAVIGCYLTNDPILNLREKYIYEYSNELDNDIKIAAMEELNRRASL